MSYNQQYPPPQGQQQQQQPPRAFSPQNYQHSPTALSPTMGSGIPPNKRQRLSPNPPSPAPYQSPFGMPGAPAYPSSPYANSPQTPGYLSLPTSPAAMQPPPFHQPQPYQQPNTHSPAPQSSMPPPKVPYSKTTDNSELEKANARDLDVNNISDVLTGSGIDLRAEEDNLLQNYRSFTSQGSASTVSPHGSFNNWNQQGHGAYQGTGPLSQEMTKEQQQAEFIRKHEQAARILNESAQHPLNDPFLSASVLRHRIAKRGYEHGIQINVDGLFDKIPDKGQQEITRSTQTGANGEQIIGLEAASLLNQNAPLVEILTLITLAAEERVRTLVEDSFALCQGRQNTSDGVIPPQMVDIAVIDENAQEKMVRPVNILKTPWEAPDSAVSPTATANKGLPNAARLPTPPSEAPPTPQRTFQNVNRVANALTKRVQDDYKWEQERLRKRAKRQAGVSSTSADAPAIPIPLPEPVTKKALAAAKKQSQSDVVVFGKANETASMALGGKKKKYSWMTGGGGGGGGGGGSASGASTPRPVAASGGSGTATPAVQAPEKALIGRKRKFGEAIEQTETGAGIQLRDLIHVLENDGREKKTLTLILARMKNTDKDMKTEVNRNLPPISTNVPGRV